MGLIRQIQSGATMAAGFSEPSPRSGQSSAAVEGKLCVHGGRTKDFDKEKSGVASSVYSFDPLLESWSASKCSGVPPPALYSCDSASAGHHVYVYGGWDRSNDQRALYELDTRRCKWKQLSSSGPMRKCGCGMVAYGSKFVIWWIWNPI